MAGNIKGIMIEIGGNSTKLDKALAGSKKTSRELQVELRQVNQLLKFDPTNTTLLAQKQELLKETIEETSKQLDVLKEAEKQVTEQFKNGEASEEQVRALEREIIKTQKALDDMNSELKTTEKTMKNVEKGTDSAEKHTKEYKESVEKAKNELKEFKDKASEAFETLEKGATVVAGAITAAGGYSLKLAADFDQAFNTLITKTGASTEELESLNESMENIYANNFGESIEDVAESMATVKNSTNLTGKELEKVTENALLMRDTFGFEVDESIRAVNSLMKQFGITAEEAYALIAQGAQKGLNQNGDLMDVINEYSVQFQNAGYSAEDMFNMLANGVEAGTWSVDKLGDAVKEFNIRMSDGSAKEAVEALGFSWETVSESWSKGGDEAKTVFNMLFNELNGLENTTEGYAIGVGLLGTMYEDLGQDAVLALSDTQGEISKTSDALQKINETKYDDIGSALQGLGRTIETDVIVPLGEELTPAVEEVIDYVQENGPEIKETLAAIVEKIGEFVGFIVDNGSFILSIIVGIGAGMLAWNVAAMITGVVNAIKAYKLANEGATVSQALFNAVLNANPIVLVISLVVALVAAIITFIATNENARKKIKEIWEAITKFFTDAWQAIVNTWDKAKTYFQELWNKVKESFGDVKTWFSETFSGAWQSVKDVFAEWGDFFGGLWDTIKEKFSDLGTKISDAIGGAVKAGINGVISLIEDRINSAINLINGAIDVINKLPGVNVSKLSTLELPRLAKGGVLREGSAIMAEAGPELISMVNGKAVVTPLTKTAKNTAVGTANVGGFTQNNNYYSPKALDPSESARLTRNATRSMVLKMQRG